MYIYTGWADPFQNRTASIHWNGHQGIARLISSLSVFVLQHPGQALVDGTHVVLAQGSKDKF